MTYAPKREPAHYINTFRKFECLNTMSRNNLPELLAEVAAECYNSGYDQAVIDMGKLKREGNL